MLYAFPDTNLFLEFREVQSLPWADLLGSPEFTLLIAPVVLSELDAKKSSSSNRLRKRARAAIRAIKSAIDDPAGWQGPAIAALPAEPLIDFASRQLDPSVPDDRLLASAIEFDEDQRDDEVVLVTDDLGLQIKAAARAVRVECFDETFRAEGMTDEEKNNVALKGELAALRSQRPEPELYSSLEDDALPAITLSPSLPLDSSAIMAEGMAAIREKYPLLKRPTGNPAGIGSQFLTGIATWPTPSSPENRNAYREEYYAEYEAYLAALIGYFKRMRLIRPLQVVVGNRGGTPALDVELRVQLSAPGLRFIDAPDLPEKPKEPLFKKPSIYETAIRLNTPVLPRAFLVEDPGVTVSGPINAIGSVRKLRHFEEVALPVMYIQLVAGEAASGRLDWQLHCDNVREPRRGSLGLIVEEGRG